MDQASHHEQQLQVQQDIIAALEKAAAVLSKDEMNLLVWATGLSNQEKQNGTLRAG